MSSSISSSEAEAADRQIWTRWLALFIATFLGATGLLYAFIVVSDPFSTGRFTPLTNVDIAFSGRTHANAGRARDPAFDSAVIGNSVGVRFQPELLDKATGRRFVQLSIPGLGPDEELTLARAFVRERGTGARTLVFMMHFFWCATQERDIHRFPEFPGWLYEQDRLTYLRRILSMDSAQAAFHRAAIRLGLARPSARADGYHPNDHRGVWSPERVAKLAAATGRPTDAPPQPWNFIALDRLQQLLQSIDPATEVVLLWVPAHVSVLAAPGSERAAWIEACKARSLAMAQARPNTIVIDRMVEDDVTRNPNNFWDATHVLDSIVRDLEAEIAKALRR